MNRYKRMLVFAAVVAWLVAGSFIALYIGSALFLALVKINPLNATFHFWTWIDYWSWYHHVPAVKKRLIVSLVVGCGIAFGLPIFALAKIFEQRQSLFGEARFATFSEVKKAGLV
jgi:type IV secretion system protein VirD4